MLLTNSEKREFLVINCRCGHGSAPKEPTSKNTTKKFGSHKSTRQQGGSAGSNVSDTYPVPNFVAVVTDGKDTKTKGYSPLEDVLAHGLAKYFESRTEIEYSILVHKMKEVPERHILKLLGIKEKEDETQSKKQEDESQPKKQE